ncbi:response regulator [Paenibacillus sp. Soil787]|uniref:response regulator transcription factor n=1 Tax=Paenibacillus sp. Soil787 TaxID=1736411 RepID=UPI0006FA7BEF|nr:response regulator [Paenibacillus sp. Soil787]KRF43659.1 hypothetical protein ASG93_01690 [Paenibacillus sp. Soil787]
MLKAIIVDDEKLVRKGIISIFPWDKYGIEVVGEAGNGELALEILQEHAVDLIFVDLTMPIMGGLELMKIIGERFPYTWMVVLTCHQDFTYIQEALRLGAIDYIIKTQLDQEMIEHALERITSRIIKEKQNRIPAESCASNEYEICGHVLVGEDKSEQFPLEFIEPELVIKIDNGVWFITSMKHSDAYVQAQSCISWQTNSIWLDVEGRNPQSTPFFYDRLRVIVPFIQFYHFEPGQKMGKLSLKTISEFRLNSDEEWRLVEDQWLDMRWIYDDEHFAVLLKKMVHAMPEPNKVHNLMNELMTPWLEIVQNEPDRKRLQNNDQFLLWTFLVDWFKETRTAIRNEMKQHSYGAEIVVNLVKAIRHIQQTTDYSFSRDELAAKYLMSGGYFSQIFKETVRKPYGEYLKEIRLRKAVDYLNETNLPIYQIAEQTGFQDEKYFSKLFRDHYGINPNDYRKQRISNSGEKE